MQAILAHELCHLRRKDNLTAAFHMLVEALFWFYPLVWWLGARLIAERERSCDEAVLEAGNEPKTYVEGVLKVCKFYLNSSLACAAGVSGGDLNKRMETIMDNRRSIRLTKIKKAILGISASLAIMLPLVTGLLTPTLSLGNTTAQAETNSCEVRPLRPLKSELPPYPAASQKAKEEGAAVLQVVIGKDGVPTSVTKINSSGFPRLDDASIHWIKETERWAPLPHGGPNLLHRK
jgi:TonB family protein